MNNKGKQRRRTIAQFHVNANFLTLDLNMHFNTDFITLLIINDVKFRTN
jgi:hypothetical protein